MWGHVIFTSRIGDKCKWLIHLTIERLSFQINADTDWYDQMNSILSQVDQRITMMKVRILTHSFMFIF